MKSFIKKMIRCLPDSLYISLQYYHHFYSFPNFKNPQKFNEKIQWLKLHDRKPQYTMMVDKYAVKEYVASVIGKQYIIPTLGIWDCAEDIDFNVLPEKFVLKCTHDSGSVVICRDKSCFDIEAAIQKLNKGLMRNGFWYGREWPYKNVKPRIIAERYLTDNPKDYKYFCFNGIPRIVLVCSERFSDGGLKEDFFDENWNHLDLCRPNHGNSKEKIEKPENHELMMSLAAELSKDIPFVRIDFYEVEGIVYFGEITFYPASGFEGFKPEEWDCKLGEWIELPKKHVGDI